jgi:hypothetical protein
LYEKLALCFGHRVNLGPSGAAFGGFDFPLRDTALPADCAPFRLTATTALNREVLSEAGAGERDQPCDAPAAALRIVRRGDLVLRNLTGVYAGAIGRTQFPIRRLRPRHSLEDLFHVEVW